MMMISCLEFQLHDSFIFGGVIGEISFLSGDFMGDDD